MTLADAPFEPISVAEADDAKAPAKQPDKEPIVPVPDDAPECNFRIPALGGAPKRMWEYRDAEGRLLGYDARFEHEVDGVLQKDVLPVTFCQIGDKRGWRSKALPAPRPLYGLDRLASRPNAPVVIAEGAKSADAAAALLPDYVAVSWSGGANAISQTYWLALKGRDVLIWPDRDRHCELAGPEKPYEDQPGTIAAGNIVARLNGVAASIRVLDLESWNCIDGWDADDALKDGWTPQRAAQFVETYAKDLQAAALGTLMPFNFENREDGLYYIESESRSLRICGRLKVLAKTRDQQGTSWGLFLEWRDDDGRVHRWAMPKAMLAGDGSSIREALLEQGLYVSPESKARAKLLEFLSSVDTTVRGRAATRVGWLGGSFALPHLTIGDTPNDCVIFQNPEVASHYYATAGTLADWQKKVAAPAIGNSRLVFMIAAAFVGPLLELTAAEGGGVNVVGPSSCGKTTGLRAAASVWGPPKFMRTWRATGNGLEGVAVLHSETLLCLDELGQLEPREAGAVAYMLANGQGKARATRVGGSRAAATWNLMYLSTGEIGLADLAREKGGKGPQAGQEVRILDIPADAEKGMGLFENIASATSPEAFSIQIKDAATDYYGTAAEAYLHELAAIRDQARDIIAESIGMFTEAFVPKDADGQVKRAGRRFGLIAAAGELATALGVLPWPKDEAFEASGLLFRAWIARRGGVGSAEDRNIVDRLAQFIEAHGDSRFSPMVEPDAGFSRPVINRVGFWRSKSNATGESVREYLILPEAFKEIFQGFDLSQVKRLLADRGYLELDSAKKYSKVERLPELGMKRCYVISNLGDAHEG